MHIRRFSWTFMSIVFSLCFIHLFSCTEGSGSGPELSISDASAVRGITESTMRFQINLNKPSANDLSVDYVLAAGTATAPADFVSASGTVTISANQTLSTIDVVIKGNALNIRQPNLQFTVNLSNPRSCTLSRTSATGTIITEDGTYLPTDSTGYRTPLIYPGYSLVWSDEFTGNSLNLNSWNQEIGNGSGGWGNNELEYYTNSTKNTFVSNGNLIIEAREETIGTFNYTSGRMTTQDKKFFKFGRIDIRAKLPVGKGLWPALWMLGSNISDAGWPACGEIDIMELIGVSPSTVYGTLHWKNASGEHASKGANLALLSGDYSKEFHVFSIIWKQDDITWYIDDQQFLDISVSDIAPAENPFNSNQFFIFNVAVGGNWPGPTDNTTEFPERMFVDYIRVFQ